MSNLDNFTETTNPQNRFMCLPHDQIYNIIINGSAKHTFIIPFIYSNIVESGHIFYKQGLTTVLGIQIEPSMVTEDIKNNMSYIVIQLSPGQTAIFNNTVLDTACQFEFMTLNNDVLYSDKYKVIVEEPISIPSNIN